MNLIFKYLKTLILFIAILMPLFFYFSIDSISKQTYEKRYFLVKKDEPSFIRKAKIDKTPIINSDSIKQFSKSSILTIFNYETPFAIEKINNNKNIFSDVGFDSFINIFSFLINKERDDGILIKKTTIIEGPYIMGTFRFINGNAYQLYMKIQETKTGFNEVPTTDTKNVFIIIVEDDFKLNSKGLSVDSLNIR